MRKIRIRYSFVLLLLSSLMLGCRILTDINQDPFYRDKGGWDSTRFPLIKPYYVIMVNRDGDWQIPLPAEITSKEMYYYISLRYIEQIAVENDVIMIYTPFMEIVDESIGQKVLHWFVLVPEKKVEVGFDNEADFLKYINSYGIDDPVWRKPDSIYEQFSKTRCLDWIPKCNE